MENKLPFFWFYIFNIFVCGILFGDTNVLLNPGFENGVNEWQSRGGDIKAISTSPYSGTYSGHAYNRSASWNGIQQNMHGRMVEGATYQISGWIKTSSSSNSDIHITFQKNDDSNSGSPEYKWAGSGTANSSGWTYITGSYTLNVTGTLSSLIVYIEGPDSGIDIYIDDITVYGPEVSIATEASGVINASIRHQIIEGFGAAGAWYEGWLTAHPNKETLYDILFGELGLDIYRLRNTYGQGTSGSTFMDRSAEIVSEAKERNPSLKILMSSWSPPEYLKSNGQISGGDNATLTGGPGSYDYAGFANWWVDSISAWNNAGIDIDYISIQNEPDFDAGWDSCRFDPGETATAAGYNKAFEAVYNEIESQFESSMPKMLAPEATGFLGASGSNLNAYLTAIINPDHVYGYNHHLYNINAGDNPDQYINQMQYYKTNWGDKPLFQTEYEKTSASWPDALNMSILMHNALTEEDVSGYFYWSLFWSEPGGLVSFPSYGSSGYTINSDFYGFKHYSAFIHPGWQRIDATDDSSDIRISSYISPDNSQITVVAINTNATNSIILNLTFDSVSIVSGGIYRTSETENCTLVNSYNPATELSLPARSVTTLSLITNISTTPPDAPENLEAIAGDKKVSLSWLENSENDLEGYNIYKSTLPGIEYAKINDFILKNPNFTDNQVQNFTNYYYVVTAVDTDSNESVYSAEVKAMPYDGRLKELCDIDFEDDFGSWTNISTGDSHDWTRNTGSTVSLQTGPDRGANDSSWYAYLEATDANTAGNSSILESPVINGFGRELTFYYHMYGANIGMLYVDVFDDIWHESIWSLSGQHHNSESEEYSKATIDLTEYFGLIQIRIRAVAAGSWRGDIAIDDIVVTGATLYGDINNDNIIDVSDIPGFASYWMSENCEMDINNDCRVNMIEFSELAKNWLDTSYQ